MNMNSRAARILQLSLSQNNTAKPVGEPKVIRPHLDLSTESAADTIENVCLNDTAENCIQLDCFQNSSLFENESPTLENNKFSKTSQDTESAPALSSPAALEISLETTPVPLLSPITSQPSAASFQTPEQVSHDLLTSKNGEGQLSFVDLLQSSPQASVTNTLALETLQLPEYCHPKLSSTPTPSSSTGTLDAQATSPHLTAPIAEMLQLPSPSPDDSHLPDIPIQASSTPLQPVSNNATSPTSALCFPVIEGIRLPTEEESLQSAKSKKRGPGEWKQNVQKRRRELGQEYKMRNGGMAPARSMGETCQCKAVGKECSLFTQDDRLQIFSHVWALSWDEKRNFVYGLVDQVEVKRKRSTDGPKKRQCTFNYSLKKNGQKHSVCLKMFLSTTGLTKHFTMSIFEKTNATAVFLNGSEADLSLPIITKPKKQRLNPYYQRGEDSRQLLNQFLDELPKMPSHYCRKSSSKLYLERSFKSLTEVHTAYEHYCAERDLQPLKLTAFKEAFHDRNLSLFKPKKDRCNLCIGHEAGNVSDEEWSAHMQFKNEALAEKELDKTKAIASFKAGDKNFAAFCMDLQSVLLAPSTEANAMYFKTKLTVHNFTVYDLASGAVSCYVWNETEGGVTANEFASCIRHYLESMDQYKEIIIYSDGCTYQNRNVVLGNALQQFVNSTGTVIQHKYLVRGHTHMEVDNSHSLIERALEGRTINVPYDYVEVMKKARKKPSAFTVHYLTHDFFRDFSGIGPYDSLRPGKKAGDPTLTDVHCFKYIPDANSTKQPVLYKLNFKDDFSEIPVPRDFCKKESKNPTQLYQEQLKIPKSKYQHLQELKAVIGKDYHAYYDQLSYNQ